EVLIQMIYLIGWLAIYVTLLLQSIIRYKGRSFIFLLLLLFGLVAGLRGEVGTDTRNYEYIIEKIVDIFQWDGWEQGFIALSWLLTSISPSVEIAVRLISVVFFVGIAVFLLHSNKNERFLLNSYVLPAFGWQYGMNALRIGIASLILLFAVQAARRSSSI